MIRGFRVFAAQHAEHALTGEGARLFGGRWNSKGRPVVYAASSLSLAFLEIMVHLEDFASLARGYAFLELRFDPEMLQTVEPTRLASDVRSMSAAECAALGDAWLASKASLALAVPSVVVPIENIYLLNPLHPDMGRVRAGEIRPLAADPRLARR